jgi:hypothetical protein
LLTEAPCRRDVAEDGDYLKGTQALARPLLHPVPAPLGRSTVTIGQMSGTVVRHFMGGIAVEFFRPIPVEDFNET